MPKVLTTENRENKVKSLEELSRLSQQLKQKAKKIVLCHGVFDLLHVGHIRHFRAAKKRGDVLIVTITQDEHVNKGPHRPAFPESLRAEAIAALDCVDFVAISRSPQAVQVIELLRPDYYAKGADYKDASIDHTGGIKVEENAVQAAGGQLIFTNEVNFSASTLINQHFSSFSDEVNDFRERFSKKFRSDDIIGFIERGRKQKVLVIGEAIIDEYQYCMALGKSSKEPMLAVKRISTESFLGGALAVANHVANFSDDISLLTFLGDRESHERFIQKGLNKKIKSTFLYRTDSPTIVKRRFIENYFFTKLMEVYDINDGALTAKDNKRLCSALEKVIANYDVVIVMDFGHSMFTDEAIQILCDKSRFLAVNAQTNAGNVGYQSLGRYQRANYVTITESEIRMEARNRRGELKDIMLSLAQRNKYDRISVTRGQNGCLAYEKGKGLVTVPALAGKVVDRMGAGDAFLSLTALCVASGAPTEAVAFIGNVAGAQSVATIGHRSSLERAPLYKNIVSLMK